MALIFPKSFDNYVRFGAIVAGILALGGAGLGLYMTWPANLKTDDEINGWIYETYRERSVQEILDESRQVFQQFLRLAPP